MPAEVRECYKSIIVGDTPRSGINTIFDETLRQKEMSIQVYEQSLIEPIYYDDSYLRQQFHGKKIGEFEISITIE